MTDISSLSRSLAFYDLLIADFLSSLHHGAKPLKLGGSMKPKPWSMNVGVGIGLIVGMLAWWSSYAPGAGLFQNPQLVIVPVAIGIVIVTVRNRRRKVGPYDPELIARNKHGRV
ncbi:hypothetical protein [Sphingomonas sp. DBB INV C78]|uniref:hypothetical protein n=1 Tax=Sphingomonas sp. DBB INV C78 TaxID=3349434 RepID=UPI0036D35DF4